MELQKIEKILDDIFGKLVTKIEWEDEGVGAIFFHRVSCLEVEWFSKCRERGIDIDTITVEHGKMVAVFYLI
jgi:hypothetical protein